MSFGLSSLACFLLAASVALPARAAELVRGERRQWTHSTAGTHAAPSGAAVAVRSDGTPLLAWIAPEGDVNHLWVVAPGESGAAPVRVDPPGLAVDSLHQAPGLACGAGGEVVVSWSSVKPKPEGTLFASDLRLSRSGDGGRTFGAPLRVNPDRPISHSFDGLAVAAGGSVLLAWIDSREGWQKAGTYVARVAAGGTKVDRVEQVGSETCVCCRVAVATGGAILVAWEDSTAVRRRILARLSVDGGKTFGPVEQLSSARVKAHSPALAAAPSGGFALAWTEEEFPVTRSVVQMLRVAGT